MSSHLLVDMASYVVVRIDESRSIVAVITVSIDTSDFRCDSEWRDFGGQYGSGEKQQRFGSICVDISGLHHMNLSCCE